jgi:hypothetical protein
MFDKRTQVIIDALVDQIKKLQLDVLLRDTEIEQLKEKLKEKEAANG